jgi:hypothetical protein
MKRHQHRPILLFTIMVLLAIPVVGGGPIAFVLLVMTAPPVILMGVSAWMVLNGGSTSHGSDQRRDTRTGGRVE